MGDGRRMVCLCWFEDGRFEWGLTQSNRLFAMRCYLREFGVCDLSLPAPPPLDLHGNLPKSISH